MHVQCTYNVHVCRMKGVNTRCRVQDKYLEGEGVDQIPYSGKLSREKTFMNFMVLEPPMKVFSIKFGHAVPGFNIL